MQDLAKTYFPERWHALRAARWFDIGAGPLASLIHGIGMLASAVGQHITWRHIRYRLLRGGRIVRQRCDPRPTPVDDSIRRAA